MVVIVISQLMIKLLYLQLEKMELQGHQEQLGLQELQEQLELQEHLDTMVINIEQIIIFRLLGLPELLV